MARHETRHMGDGSEIVIPKHMRDRLDIKPGDEVTFEERADGVVILPGGASERGEGGRSRSTGRSGRSTSGGPTSGRRSRATSVRSSSEPRHAERKDDCF